MIKHILNPSKNVNKVKRLKNVRLHKEGTTTLIVAFVVIGTLCYLIYVVFRNMTLFKVLLSVCVSVYLLLLNFFRCPIRKFSGEIATNVIAPADGTIVVIEEIEENEYFHDRRMMISIFMSIFNVHANWYPVEGDVVKVCHHHGNYAKAWLPKASTENERSTVVIRTNDGLDVMVRQIAGAMARRIVTYAKEGDCCYIDEHLGFIKFGSRVDVYLPIDSEVFVTLGQKTKGNQTVIAKLK